MVIPSDFQEFFFFKICVFFGQENTIHCSGPAVVFRKILITHAHHSSSLFRKPLTMRKTGFFGVNVRKFVEMREKAMKSVMGQFVAP